jgi:LacI family transcriptional regulator
VATINDVAARAGVSRTTTSRVLNNRPKVDAETRRRVQRAIQELGYVPSPTARRLSLGRTWTVDVVASYLTRPQAIERLRGAESVLGDTAFDLVVHNVESPERRERYLRELPASNRTDGVLLVSLPPASDNLRRLAVGPVPVVVIDVHGQGAEGLPVVRGDDLAGGAIAAATFSPSVTARSASWPTRSTTPTASRRAAIGTPASPMCSENSASRWRPHSVLTDHGARATLRCGC